MREFDDSQLRQLCEALGWQGGTFHQVLVELRRQREALSEIALAGMSGSGQESKEGMQAWHARRAWEFIGIAARALSPAGVMVDAPPSSDRATCPAHGGNYHWTLDCPECVKDARERGMGMDDYCRRVRPTLPACGVAGTRNDQQEKP